MLMKHLTQILTLSSLLIFNSSPALAVNPSVTPSPTRQEEKRELKEIRVNTKATITQTRFEANKKRIEMLYTGLLNAFNRQFTALTRHQVRIQTRLDEKKAKLGASNSNLVSAQAKLSTVSTLTTTFNNDLTAFKNESILVSNSPNPKAKTPQLKTLAKTIETDLKNIRRNLVEALRLIVQAK